MALPLPFDTQGFPVVNAITWGGGAPAPVPGALPVIDVTPFVTGTPRAPTAVADNLVHEVTDPAGAGMQLGYAYCVTQIGGADLCLYVAAAAPAVAVCRRGFHLYSGLPWLLRPTAAGLHAWVVKAVDGTADANVSVQATDGGTGA